MNANNENKMKNEINVKKKINEILNIRKKKINSNKNIDNEYKWKKKK